MPKLIDAESLDRWLTEKIAFADKRKAKGYIYYANVGKAFQSARAELRRRMKKEAKE